MSRAQKSGITWTRTCARICDPVLLYTAKAVTEMKRSVIEVKALSLRKEIYMANRTRDIPIQFFVTAEEKKMIRKKMILSRTANMGAYLRKMAIDGIIVNTDTTYLEKQFYEMHKIGVNVNQLARLANSTGAVTPEEIKELKGMIKEIWHILRSSASNLQ